MATDCRSRLIVTVDGPAGSGKSTLAKRLARRADLRYLESGAFYRAAAWLATRAQGDLTDPDWMAALLTAHPLQVTAGRDRFYLAIAGRDLTADLRLPHIGQNASVVAMLRPVRRWVLDNLWALGAEGGLVAEGRDMGSRVFPEAPVKIFLDASLAVRAHRRWLELQAQGNNFSEEEVRQDMAQRDRRDRERQEDPLRVPAGAHCIDTTTYEPDQVEEICFQLIQPYL